MHRQKINIIKFLNSTLISSLILMENNSPNRTLEGDFATAKIIVNLTNVVSCLPSVPAAGSELRATK